MTSLRYKLFETALRLVGVGGAIAKGLKHGNIPSEAVPRSVRDRWERSEFEGRDIWTCRPKGLNSGRVYVHQHGGAYVIGLIALHFTMFTRLADMSGVTIILPDYPLPPDQVAEGIIDWAVSHFESVAAEHGRENIMLGGDSAGGNLALGISQKTQIENPVLLLSPWVDLDGSTLPNDGVNSELLLKPVSLKAAGHRYAGGRDPKESLISPIFAETSALPDVMIFTGEKDLLHDSIQTFASRLSSAGKLAKLAVYGEFGHYLMFYPVPDRESTLTELAVIIAREHPLGRYSRP